MEIDWDLDKQYIFLIEYFVHEAVYAHPLNLAKQPALAFRFLDFPTQILHSREPQKLTFKCGKKCRFAMNPAYLRKGLFENPFYVMLVDATKDNVQILASSSVNISCFTKDNDFLKLASENKQIRRNTVILFDKVRNEVGKIDLTLCISRDSTVPIQKPIIEAEKSEMKIEKIVHEIKEEMPISEPPEIIKKPEPKIMSTIGIQAKIEEKKPNSENENLSNQKSKTVPENKEEKSFKSQKIEKKTISIADMAQQTYCPPAMFFEKK